MKAMHLVGVLLIWIGTWSHPCSASSSSAYLWKSLVEVPTSSLAKMFMPSYIDLEHDNILDNGNISLGCRRDLQASLDAFKKRQTWAFQLFNAWGKFPPSGTLAGTLTDYGDYDQCMSINHNHAAPPSEYCLVDVAVPMPTMPQAHNYYQRATVLPEPTGHGEDGLGNTTLYRHFDARSSVFYYVYVRVGVCLPAACLQEDIQLIASRESSRVGLQLKRVSCETQTKWKANLVQMLAITLALTMLLVVTAAALVDRFCNSSTEKSSLHILAWFSPVRNIKKLVCTESNEDLTCVHGLRFVTMVWIIIAHTLEWNNLNTFRDTLSIPSRLSSLDKQPIYKGHYTVETFFYLSGMLTSYVTLKYTNGEYKNFRYSSFLLLRYLRLTPQLGVFLIVTSLLPVMYDGPLWPSYIAKVTDKCYATWWHNLIYLHNMIDIRNICAIHTWYLSADMQLHWMSLIPVVLLLKNPKNGIRFTRALIGFCLLISAFTLFWHKLPPGSVITAKNDFLDEDGRPSQFIKFFYQPWTHANVFFIGFIFGAFIRDLDLNKFVLNKSSKYLCWMVVFVGYLFCVYSTLPWLYGRPYEPLWSAIIFPLNSTVWALMLTLVIWLCITKNGSVIGALLSWSGFRALSRMTYAVYLCHAWVCWVVLGTRRDLIDLSTRSLVIMMMGIVVVSYMVGFIFTIMFETPVIHLIEHIKDTWLEKNPHFRKGLREGENEKANNNDEQVNKMKLLEMVAISNN